RTTDARRGARGRLPFVEVGEDPCERGDSGLLDAERRGGDATADRALADPDLLGRRALRAAVRKHVVDLPALLGAPVARVDQQADQSLCVVGAVGIRGGDRDPRRRLLRAVDGGARMDERGSAACPDLVRQGEVYGARTDSVAPVLRTGESKGDVECRVSRGDEGLHLVARRALGWEG